MPKKACKPEFLVPTLKHGDGSVMIWASIYWYSAGPIITLNGRIMSVTMWTLGNWVHPMVHMLFPNNDAVFQDDILPIHTARSVKSWFEEHEDALKHLPWPAQSPDLSIIKSLLSVLESRVRSRFPPPSSLKQLEDVLHKEWYNIPLETIQNIHDSIPRGIQAVLQTAVAKLCINKKLRIFHDCFHYFDHPLYVFIQ